MPSLIPEDLIQAGTHSPLGLLSMSADYVYTLNRELLGTSGLGLSDDNYVRVVAAMGVRSLLDLPKIGPAEREIAWTLGAFRAARRSFGKVPLQDFAPRQVDAWVALVKDGGVARASIRAADAWTKSIEPIDMLGVLSHPATGLTAAWLEWNCRQADPRWRWPLRIGAFADDFEELGLAELADSNQWPANKLTQPRVISRDETRAEVLILRGEVRSALARILTLKHRVRAGLVMLVAPLDVPWAELRSQLDTLLAETQAAGVAVIQPDPARGLVVQLNGWIEQLSHNVPLDVAVATAFGTGRVLLALDRRLLNVVELNRAFQVVATRLRGVLAAAKFFLTDDTRRRIDLKWEGHEPVSELAKELSARAATGDISLIRESMGASAVAEIETATRSAERTQAADEGPRYLQGDVYRFSHSEAVKETRGLLLNTQHALDLFIGEAGLGAIEANVPVPDKDIDWGAQGKVTLQVMLAEPNQWDEPLRGTLKLPRYGRSSTQRFVFSPTKAGPFQGRVTLYYRGRILQTALLETSVVTSPAELVVTEDGRPGVALRVEAELRRSFASLSDRRRFDACIVCNHTGTRQAALTAAGRHGAYIASLNGLENALASISHLLTQVAQDAARYSKGLKSKANAELLGHLAVEGNTLYRKIVLDYIDRSTSAKTIQEADYLQIVTMEPDAIVPLEFIYDYPPPEENAPVCPNAEQALRNGSCPKTCKPKVSPAKHVCPMGFWGLRKVIERHVHVPKLSKAAKIIASEPITGRDELSLKGSTLVGISQQVESPSDQSLIKGLKKIRKSGVKTARNWAEWIAAISADKPVMLVALPHADGTAADITLEIGGDTKKSVYIDNTYVHVKSTPPPLTVLLGCDTANAADTSAYLHHVGVFRQADAALVVGTIATVFGKHAADMTERLVEHLEGAIQSKPGRFGEVLLRAKRTAVADSLMIGLCLVAFGDADWKIVPDED